MLSSNTSGSIAWCVYMYDALFRNVTDQRDTDLTSSLTHSKAMECKRMTWKVLLSLVLMVCSASAANKTHCFECTDLPNPAYCQRTTQCTEGQKCVVEEVVSSGGLVLFNSGCMSLTRCSGTGRRSGSVPGQEPMSTLTTDLAEDDLTLCVECCEGDFCNRQGCGTVAKKLPDRGPLCFECDYLDDPEKCRNVVQCGDDEVCMLIEWSPPVADGRSIYRSSCHRPDGCPDGSHLQLDKRRAAPCHTCCKEDFCNDKCTSATSAPLTPSSTQQPSSTAQVSSSVTHGSTPASTMTTSNISSTVPISATISTSSSTLVSSSMSSKPSLSTISPASTSSTPQTQTTNAPHHTTSKRCPHHRFHYDPDSGMCFAIHSGHHGKIWEEANHHCKNEDAVLAVVDTEAKWRFLQTLLNDKGHYPAYIGGIYNGTTYQWVNGASFTFTAWSDGQPDTSEGSCVIVNDEDHKWQSSACDTKMTYVCTKEFSTPSTSTSAIPSSTSTVSTNLTSSPKPTLVTTQPLSSTIATQSSTLTLSSTTPRPTTHIQTTMKVTTAAPTVSTTSKTSLRELCESHRYTYEEHDNLCYALHDDHATWDEANNRCKKEGGMLAVVDTQKKWHALQRAITHRYHHEDVFIGGRGLGTHSQDYNWTNGARFTFTAWSHGQPDDSHEECVCVNSRDGHWHDTYCHYQLKFVCTIEL